MPTPITGQTSKSPDPKTKRGQSPLSAVTSNGRDPFVVPVLRVHVPESLVNVGFWGTLAGAAALGAIDLPLAALIGMGSSSRGTTTEMIIPDALPYDADALSDNQFVAAGHVAFVV